MNKFMNLIGVKARKASEIKIVTNTKNKVLNDYALLIDKEKKNILIENENFYHVIRNKHKVRVSGELMHNLNNDMQSHL